MLVRSIWESTTPLCMNNYNWTLTIWNKVLSNFIAWKVLKHGVFFGLHFPASRLNTERYGVFLRIQSDCGKIRTRKNSVFGHFWRSVWTLILHHSDKRLDLNGYKLASADKLGIITNFTSYPYLCDILLWQNY